MGHVAIPKEPQLLTPSSPSGPTHQAMPGCLGCLGSVGCLRTPESGLQVFLIYAGWTYAVLAPLIQVKVVKAHVGQSPPVKHLDISFQIHNRVPHLAGNRLATLTELSL